MSTLASDSEYLRTIIKAHNLAVEQLTIEQFVDVIRQMIASGDIIRYVRNADGIGESQSVVYIPFHEAERWKDKYHELIMAVGNKYDGETRHETALRYIRQAESCQGGPAQESTNSDQPADA